MDVIFTDLDGTLLDLNTYDWEAARPALEHLRRQAIPWILVTSKTRAEVEVWRNRLENRHPFIVENGGAAFVPAGYFQHPVGGARRRGAYEVLEWGTAYGDLVAGLKRAAELSGCRVRGFHEMTAEEVAAECGLARDEALLAKQREYDEPFLVLDPDRGEALASAISGQGLRSTRGGRFWHILGANDKALAVDALASFFGRRQSGLRTIGLGDGLNDASFLKRMAAAVLIPSPQLAELKALVPHGLIASHPGPIGWNEAVLALTLG